MKTLFICILIVFASVAKASFFYNTASREKTTELPNPLISGGIAKFNPRLSDYNADNWYKGVSESVPFGYAVTATNYVLTNYFRVSFTNGMYVTNWSRGTPNTILEKFDLAPIVVDKPLFIQASEAQYTLAWAAVFGEYDFGFTNASYDDVAVSIMQISQTNQSVLEYTHAMERSFTFLQTWWTSVTQRASFHPYPWGMTTNIVLKDIVTLP